MTERFRWTVLAHLLRPQGRHGEILADLLTDFPDRLTGRPDLVLAAPGFTGPPEQARTVEITAHWLPVGRNSGRVVLALGGVSTIEAAATLAGLDLLIPTSDRVPLEPGAEYIDDLIGCTVFDGEEPLGTISAVEFSTTPDGTRRLLDVAPTLTVVTTGGDELLIPYVEAFLLSQDTAGGEIRMRLPPGLVDLNR